ncbi:MAG TPA: hypothetical protein DEO70_14395 [Bacteroidales bacterium]|nr:MAG: hypothetical protein A2X11_13285 [Bacteroidetes bacterium GWE2_42_24]OFY26756.1 MAG: hypothetical protein A2X09_10145 [Bacteroidetes bacterium GWF2_43_11]HBZ68021.1 hypothetical protein [Bacteroidales bacterium]
MFVYTTQTNQSPLSKQSDTEINLSHRDCINDLTGYTTRSNSFSFSEPERNIWRHLNISEFEHYASNYNHPDLLQKNLAVRSYSRMTTFYNTLLRTIKMLF